MPRADRVRVHEIFYSIQGEGTRAGWPCVFVRLTGCQLRCTYCDTEEAFYDGRWMSLDDVLGQVERFGCTFVLVTGGEPLLQPGAFELLRRLADRFETVAVETSGTVPIEDTDARVVRVMDLKTPSSGFSHRNRWENLDHLTPRDELKFVIGTREDYEWSRDVVRRRGLLGRLPITFSPVIGTPDRTGLTLYQGHLEPRLLAEWILEDRLPVRLGLQLHKLIWSPTASGV